MRVYFDEIEHGIGNRKEFLYARVYNAGSGNIEISSTLDYCLRAIKARGWTVVKRPVRKTD
jgi:hypothetical protein